MAYFYGSVTGNASVGSRGGTKHSGIRTTTQSWQGTIGVAFRLVHDEIMVEIAVAPESSAHPRQVLYLGKLSNLVNAGTLEAKG